MKYTHACFIGYAGFFHGLGLKKFEVDFTKCISNIVLIVGKNASGKTTLMNSLNLFPDSSVNFLCGIDAEKNLSLFDNGNTYTIQIISPADGKGGRKTTKAFIQKNGLELNPNGNVSSYKDIIFSEFDLDPNFISLSKLSSNDRGIGDKTPAERKKFVSNIIENLEVYNDIYKTLNKKSLIFKSHINTLSTKIQNIGNAEVLNSTLTQLKSKESIINNDMLALNNKIIAIQANNSINEQEAVQIKESNDKRTEILEALSDIDNNLKLLCNKIKVKPEEVEVLLDQSVELSNTYKEKANSANIIRLEKINRSSQVQQDINTAEAEIEKYKENIDDNVGNLLSKSNKSIKELKSELEKLGVEYSDINALLSKIPLVRSEGDNFVKAIDHIYSYCNPEMLDYICTKDLNEELKKVREKYQKYDNIILESKQLMTEMIDQMKSLATLENRPKKCNINSCPFISEALKVKGIIGDRNLADEFVALEKKISDNSTLLAKTDEEIADINSYITERSKLDIIIDRVMTLSSYSSLVPDYIGDKAKLLSMINNNYYFNEIRTGDRLNTIESLLISLNSELDNNKYLQLEYKRYSDNVSVLNSTVNRLSKLKEEYQTLLGEVEENNNVYNSNTDLYNEIAPRIDTLRTINRYLNNKKDLEFDLESIDRILKNYKDKSDLAASMVLNIQEYQNSIESMKQELVPIQQEISRINGQLILLNSYYEEYNQYNNKYNLIETVKKYCSPTGGGIQTVFMQLYMSKTLDLSNQLLGMLFQGEYKLLDFIINENEFRIPFMDSSGIPIEDVAFGSNAQVSMIGLVINLVLLYQASSHYNIARLDEIGSSCDSYNRSQYIQVLNAVINILHMEQLFVISHDIDLDNTMCDIIKLKGYDGFDNSSLQGNVIYDYDEIIKGGVENAT